MNHIDSIKKNIELSKKELESMDIKKNKLYVKFYNDAIKSLDKLYNTLLLFSNDIDKAEYNKINTNIKRIVDNTKKNVIKLNAAILNDPDNEIIEINNPVVYPQYVYYEYDD